ncbi:MAG TPA: hypothetical protein VJR30_12190 [Bradyrhizobium sp.]|nr:hypothetical protein [Bradyrhizobium sp.]
MADYALAARNKGKFFDPYEYCGRFSGLRLNRSLTFFLNGPAISRIYIAIALARGESCGRRQEFWECGG